MRKSTKLAILVAALVALCSIAALAAETWKQDGDNWYCYDKDGNMVYGEAKKSGANYYYLDASTGAMVKNQLVDGADGYKYYYGEDGARVIGAWAKVAAENDGDGWEYMYFQPVTGKAVVNATNKTINGKKYSFDANGWMIYGFVDESGSRVNNASDAYAYYGDKTDGSAQTGWVNIKDGADENFSDSASVWFYFKTAKKVKDAVQYKVASGKKYNFASQYGQMITGWAFETASHAAHTHEGVTYSTYFGAADEGQMVKKAWIKTDEFTAEDSNKWYYLTSNGKTHGAGVDKINGKFYLFNSKNQMVSGPVVGTVSSEGTGKADPKNFVLDEDLTAAITSVDAYKTYVAGKEIMYFSGDADTDGAMKTGTQTITIDGDTVTAVFDKHGFANQGIVSSKIYINGVLQAAGDSKVAVKENKKATDGYKATFYLVNAAGAILKKTKQMDADGIYWVALGDYTVENSYKIYKFADVEYASNAATTKLNGKTFFTIGTTKYYLHEKTDDLATKGFTYVYWNTKEVE